MLQEVTHCSRTSMASRAQHPFGEMTHPFPEVPFAPVDLHRDGQCWKATNEHHSGRVDRMGFSNVMVDRPHSLSSSPSPVPGVPLPVERGSKQWPDVATVPPGQSRG
jgi:hypothetical protein